MEAVVNKKGHEKRYGVRAFAFGAYYASNGLEIAMIGYLTYYLTDSVMISAGAAGALIALAKVFDCFTDFVAGYIIDRLNLKWGKARPYSIFSVLMWLAVVLLFSVPGQLSDVAKIAYAFIMYLLADSIFRTFLTSSEPVHMKRAFNKKEQLDVVGVAGLVSGLISMVGSAMLPTLISNLENIPHGWTYIALIMAVPCGILGVLKLFFCIEKETKKEKEENKISVLTALKTLTKNKYIFIFELATLLITCLTSMGSIATYYFTYIIGDLSKMTVVSMMGIVSMVFMPLLPVLGRKFGKAEFISKALLVGIITQIFAIIFPTNIWVLGIVMAFRLACLLPQQMLNNIIIIDCMKYTEWQDGVKLEGVIGAISGAAMKIGGALAAVFSGFILSTFGYNGSLATQTDTASLAIKALYLVFPMILMILAYICLRFYKLDKMMPQIEADLAKRG